MIQMHITKAATMNTTRMNRTTLPLSVALLALGAAGTLASLAAAEPLVIVNPGFETTVNFLPFGFLTVQTPPGWQAHDPQGIIDNTLDAVGTIYPGNLPFFPAGAPQGVKVALVYIEGDVGTGPVGLRQVLAARLEPNTRYILSTQVGNIASGFSPQLNTFYNLNGFPGYAVELLAGGQVVASDHNTLASSIPEGEFRQSIVSVNIAASHPREGQLLEIRLLNLNFPGSPAAPGIEVDFDDIQLDAIACPTITTQPQSVQICLGGDVAFNIVAEGGGTLSYQWRLNGEPITEGGNGPTLEISNSVSDGIYDCTVSNQCGSMTSQEATLTLCISDFNCDGGTDGSDVESFFIAWESGEALSDVNLDGGVDGADVEVFFLRWSQGC